MEKKVKLRLSKGDLSIIMKALIGYENLTVPAMLYTIRDLYDRVAEVSFKLKYPEIKTWKIGV